VWARARIGRADFVILSEERGRAGGHLEIYLLITNECNYSVVIVEGILTKHCTGIGAMIAPKRLEDIGDKCGRGGHVIDSFSAF
jgi:hypothetical protein